MAAFWSILVTSWSNRGGDPSTLESSGRVWRYFGAFLSTAGANTMEIGSRWRRFRPMVVGTSTHTQKLECSLTGYPLSLCVWVWGWGPTTIPFASRLPVYRGVCCCNPYGHPIYIYSHTQFFYVVEIYVFEHVLFATTDGDRVRFGWVLDAFLVHFSMIFRSGAETVARRLGRHGFETVFLQLDV